MSKARGRILLLEDDVALRGLLVDVLHGEGFNTRAFDAYSELYRAALAGEGEMIVADFWGDSQRSLPDHERQEIRALTAHLPTILLTARTWAADTSAEELGTQALIRKPFNLDELLDTVERAITPPQT